ncbi:MAG: 50S ribosome-binding GTPase [Candidatus Thermoplasmatota archaeon]|nr:50S ribosome-binding GTPase [Candidatus Thermoplasmatota archaeon]MCL5889130.1 50S ribosome-binding GTPase [Candidatus Thermoplasmatota archaeon]
MRPIPTILRSDELIDKSLRKASKIDEPYDKIFENKVRKENIDRIATAESVSAIYLKRIVKKFPTSEKLHPFYEDFLQLKFGIDNYKRSLNNVQWAGEKIVELATDSIHDLKRARTAHEMVNIRKKFYGRFCSVLEHVDKDLRLLGECRDFLRKLPEIDPEKPSFVIAGMPNVGKSSLLNSLTNNDVQIAPYPFTTLNVFIGHMSAGNRKIQIVDTPGLLDRPMDERNELERRSILSLKDIRGVILFLIDYSGFSGYTMEQQEKLYDDIRAHFPKKIVRIQTKIDISERKEEIAISNINKSGIKELKDFIIKESGEFTEYGY